MKRHAPFVTRRTGETWEISCPTCEVVFLRLPLDEVPSPYTLDAITLHRCAKGAGKMDLCPEHPRKNDSMTTAELETVIEAIHSLLDEVVGKGVVNWGKVNRALKAVGQELDRREAEQANP